MTTTTVTKQLSAGGRVETTEVTDDQGRSHWIEQFTDEAGKQTGITVRHPFGSTPRVCHLHKAATFGDALECVQSLGTERHPSR